MKYHIVSIGISKHQDANANLQFAAKDATEFFQLFNLNFPGQGYRKLLIDSEATLAKIQSALGNELREAVSPEDSFFFFYSGHGAVAVDQKEDQDVALNYLVPFDATSDFQSSCVSITNLKEIFEDLPSKANFIFIDSCFSGCITANSKGFPFPKTKKIKSIKGFANTLIGNGTLIFTACKEAQESIEDPEYKNGLFTYELFKELQKIRKAQNYPAMEIFPPIAENVEKRAKEKWSHDQTPTFLGKLEGNVMLPVFVNKLKVTPDILSVPRFPQLESASFPIPLLEIEDKKQEKLINDYIKFVIKTREGGELGELTYERFCSGLLKELKIKWEKIFIENGSDINKIPDSVAKLEGESHQVFLFGAVTSVFGTTKQMEIFARYAVIILSWRSNRAGLVALISSPEIIVAELIYLVAVISLATEKLENLKILLRTEVDDPYDRDLPPKPLLGQNYIYFCDALGGHSDKVHNHIREILLSFKWLPELVPSIDEKAEDFQHQACLLLSVCMKSEGYNMWPDFARFYASRVLPFVKKIKYNNDFRKKIGLILEKKENEVIKVFVDGLAQFQTGGLSSYWWESVTSEDFLTKEEREKI